jgi:CheY-like chemotaxis protein
VADDRQSRGKTDSAPAEPGPRLAGRTALIVGDDVLNAFALTSILERWKMTVRSSESGKAALEVLRAHPDVDAVLLDIKEPELNGYETLRAIRQDARLASLPIIAILPHEQKDAREKWLAAGATDFLTRPLEIDALFERLRRWCRSSDPSDPK